LRVKKKEPKKKPIEKKNAKKKRGNQSRKTDQLGMRWLLILVKFIDRQPEMSRAFRQSIGLLTLIRLLALRARSLSAFGYCGW